MTGFFADMGIDFFMEHERRSAIMPFVHIHPQYELYFCTDNVEQTSVINGVKYVYKYPCAILS
ncbi:MAG: hypothetical protein IJY47_03205 [Clostridia bacterium]|nr:hypothetical protein [Clostridia bacterium]